MYVSVFNKKACTVAVQALRIWDSAEFLLLGVEVVFFVVRIEILVGQSNIYLQV